MLENLSTNAIVAKARSMYGARLKEEDYRALLRRQSVSEICSYLKENTHYRNILSAVNENAVHRGQLETLLHRHAFELYIKLCSFERLDEINNFYAYMITRTETAQILRCIMHLNTQTSENFITELPGFFINHASFNMLLLAKAENFDDLLAAIDHTPYYEILTQFAPEQGELIDYTRCEVALRTYFFNELLQAVKKNFSGKDRKQLEEAIRLLIDMRNIPVAYRLKVLFDEDAAHIFEKLIPQSGKVSLRLLEKAIHEKGSDAFLRMLQSSPYGQELETIENHYIEKNTHKIIYNRFKRQLRLATSAPVVLFVLIELFEIEIENITSIIEGIRYQLPAQDIEKLLIV